MQKVDYMDFGKLKDAYDAARLPYPASVMEHVFSLLNTATTVLDMGCGTGIATRQLAQRIPVVQGCDIDKRMVEKARAYPDNVRYRVAPSTTLPFDNYSFDAVTAFGAFHWFCDTPSVMEIKRVLRNSGVFIAVNKNEAGDFRKQYEDAITQVTKTAPPPSVKNTYDPKKVLTLSDFEQVCEARFSHTETFTVPQALLQIQSMSLWNTIPKDKRPHLLEHMAACFEAQAIQGVVHRPLDITVVSGKKRKSQSCTND